MFFPIFVGLQERLAVVVGGGKIATGRVQKLCKFGCRVTVIAPQISDELLEMSERNEISCIQDVYSTKYLAGAFLIVAATNVREVNDAVCKDAKNINCWVNVADCKEQSDFFFPALFESADIIGGLISKGGKNHRLAKTTAQQIRGFIGGGE